MLTQQLQVNNGDTPMKSMLGWCIKMLTLLLILKAKQVVKSCTQDGMHVHKQAKLRSPSSTYALGPKQKGHTFHHHHLLLLLLHHHEYCQQSQQ